MSRVKCKDKEVYLAKFWGESVQTVGTGRKVDTLENIWATWQSNLRENLLLVNWMATDSFKL